MNKKLQIFLLAFTLFQANSLFGQNGFIYDDANTLISDSNNAKERKAILAYYINKDTISYAQADSILKKNPFLLKAFGNNDHYFASHNLTVGGAHAQGVLGSIGSFNVTNIADGIAKFMVKRGKQELSTAFFNNFKKDLIKYPELVVMFPRAATILKNIDSYDILTVLQQLQDAFKKDLLNLPTNILSFRDKDTSMCYGDKNCIKQIDTIGNLMNGTRSIDFVIPLLTIQGIINGKNIIDITNSIATDSSLCNSKNDFGGYIKLTSILFESFRSSQESKGLFVPVNSIKTMFLNSNITNAFLGIILLKYGSLACYSNLKIAGMDLTGILSKVQAGEAALINGIQGLDNVNAFINTYKAALKQGTVSSTEVYGTVVVASVAVLAGMGYTIHEIVKGQLPSEINMLKKNLALATDFATDIQKKNYTGIFNDVNTLFTTLNIFKNNDTREKIMRYFSFASNLASASNSDEIEQALESVALPAGSYSIKQKSAWNISVNSYIGYGWDWDKNDGKLAMRGINAPIGFSISRGLCKKHGGAITFFTSIIDVGGLASNRLVNGMTDSLKQVVTLESIFSPSAQVMIEIPYVRSPIALCVGIRGTPKLSFSNGNQFVVIPSRDVFNVSILIDIPFFTLYNKPYQD
jgi:hypothetical protein